MKFMEKVFGATQTLCKMRDESFVMHAEISLGNSTIMVADCTDQWGMQPAGLFVYVDDADKTFKAALEAGASTVMEVADQSYGRSGGIKDPFGNVWWITSPLTS